MDESNWVASIPQMVKQYLGKRGFSEEETKAHMGAIDETIKSSTLVELLKQKPPQKKLASEEEAVGYIQYHFSGEQIYNVLRQQAEKIFDEYFKTIDQASVT